MDLEKGKGVARGSPVRKKTVSVTLTEPYLKGIKRLLDEGIYYSQHEVFQNALLLLFKQHGIELVEQPPGELEGA